MRFSDDDIAHFHEYGYALLPGFVSGAELERAQAALTTHFPTPEDYFADPGAHAKLTATQFSGIALFPWNHLDLNRLAVHPPLVDGVRRILGTRDIRLYKGELWPKYAGAVDYDQHLHRDFGNHTLVVPDAARRWQQITTFLLLSDVDEGCGPTAIVPRPHAERIPLSAQAPGESLAEHEVLATGQAGTLLVFATDVFHRATRMRRADAARFSLLADFKPADMSWGARHAWPAYGNKPEMSAFLSAVDSDQRSLLDFPPPGHAYWNEQTLRDTQARYPAMDMREYREAFVAAE